VSSSPCTARCGKEPRKSKHVADQAIFHLPDAASSTTTAADRPTSNQQATRKGDKIVRGIKEHGSYKKKATPLIELLYSEKKKETEPPKPKQKHAFRLN
jgi:hypothetical protein